jgi:hypothetical protein
MREDSEEEETYSDSFLAVATAVEREGRHRRRCSGREPRGRGLAAAWIFQGLGLRAAVETAAHGKDSAPASSACGLTSRGAVIVAS